jgi:microcystin-dependent protein
MATPFLAEIRLFAGNFAPVGWFLCQGQLLPINQYTALFSLLGTQYGGNGINNFALPNFSGNVPIHQGQGPGLSSYFVGQTGGENAVTLATTQLPAHTHPIGASSASATTNIPAAGTTLGVASTNAYGIPINLAPMASQLVGGGQAHENRQPFLALSFIIAYAGIFPSRN